MYQQSVILTGYHPCCGCVKFEDGQCMGDPEDCYDVDSDTSFVWQYDMK